MYLLLYLIACLLASFVSAQQPVPGAPQYLGSTMRGIEPWPPRVGGSHDDEGFLEAIKAPNVTVNYKFATPNISAPLVPGNATEESNSALPGWSISVAVRTGVPYRDEHYTAGEVTIHTPESLLTNVTEGGQKNVSVLDEWELCVIQWDLLDEPYPSALRGDDGTCSSVLSPDCIRDVQTEARKQCSTLNITNIPACANDDTRAFRTGQVAGPYPARAIREFPRGSAEMLAFSTQPAPGGARNLTSYNDMGTVAWPMLLTLGDSRRVANWSGLFCVRPTEAVNGSTLPVWENKEEEGGEGSGDGRGEEGQGDEEGAAMRIVIDRVFMFGLGAAALAYLMLW